MWKLFVLSCFICLGLGCTTAKPVIKKPKVILPTAMTGLGAMAAVSRLDVTLPKSTHALMVVDAKAFQSTMLTNKDGLGATRGALKTHFLQEWSTLFTQRLGLDPVKANHVVLAAFDKARVMAYVQGPFDSAKVKLKNTMINGKSLYTYVLNNKDIFVARADGGYVLFISRADASAWIKREAMAPKDLEWLRFQKHPSSLVHMSISQTSPFYTQVFRSRAQMMRASAIHGWVDDEQFNLMIDAEEGPRAAWRLAIDTLRVGVRKTTQNRRKNIARKDLPEALSILAASHWVARAGEAIKFTESKTTLTVTWPNVWQKDPIVFGSMIGYFMYDAAKKFQHRTILAYAQAQLKTLQLGLEQSIVSNNCVMPKATVMTPALGSSCRCKRDEKYCKIAERGWEQPTWKQIGWRTNRNHPFSYQIQEDGDRLQIVLRSDSDCNEVYTTFRASLQARKDEKGVCQITKGAMFSRNIED